MTVFVSTDFGGERLLGKARELADAWGDKIVALTSKNSSESQKLISFGADEVVTCEMASTEAWLSMIREIIVSDRSSRLLLSPSNIASNVFMGLIYAQNKGRFYPVVDQIQMLDENSSAKQFPGLNFALRKSFIPEKVVLCSLSLRFFSEPFEDSTRRGKIRTVKFENAGMDFENFSITKKMGKSSSDRLTVLIGESSGSETKGLTEKLAEKYGAFSKPYSGKIEVVYGPCVAIDVKQRVRDLPEFKSELISISTSTLPICSIADTSIITSEINEILQNMIVN